MTPSDPSNTPAAQPNQLLKNIQLAIPFAEEFIYVNATAFAGTEFDVRLSFAEVYPDQTVKTKAAVVMSPEHAAFLFMRLLNILVNTEKHSGPIRQKEWRQFYSNLEIIKTGSPEGSTGVDTEKTELP